MVTCNCAEALARISAIAPAQQPDEGDQLSLEEAEAAGYRQGLFEAATIARAAIEATSGLPACPLAARPP